MKLLRAVSRLIVGFTFIFSGFSKIIDPVGVGLIVGEYFKIIGIGSLPLLYQILGAALSGAELLLGISVLLGLRMKLSCKVAIIFISVFTGITLILAIFNPIQECGCFGEVLKLTNWQTFYKNIILLAFALLLYFQRDNFIPIAPKYWEWGFAGVYFLLVVLLSVYSYRYLPLIDFMEYKVGTDISGKLRMEENISEPNFETTLVYKRDGKVKEFTINNLPDSTWTFVDSKTKQVSSQPLTTGISFAVSDRDGNYVTDSILSINGKLFITSIPYFDRLKASGLAKIKLINDKLKERGIRYIILTGSSPLMIDSLSKDLPNIDIYYTDHKTLLTMNRSNGGLIYLNDATVSAKWSINNLPVDSFDSVISEDPELLAAKTRIREQLAAEVVAVIILLLVAVMRYICKFAYTHKIIADGNNSESESKET
ncbi:MAG: BT_3928 family protein [Bacteroidales bacterium]